MSGDIFPILLGAALGFQVAMLLLIYGAIHK